PSSSTTISLTREHVTFLPPGSFESSPAISRHLSSYCCFIFCGRNPHPATFSTCFWIRPRNFLLVKYGLSSGSLSPQTSRSRVNLTGKQHTFRFSNFVPKNVTCGTCP